MHWRTGPAPSVQHDRISVGETHRFFTNRSELKMCLGGNWRKKKEEQALFFSATLRSKNLS
ncbi:hypothetical protein [Sphingobacterium mizutaii]|uniref:hypothetical protein n=1 Tax=Sphingobacterium mizutaii TaxID=1010 RepID=UPI000AAB9935|nr:hypothetical protein [Sphingobacterium mizutaii]